MSSYSQFSHMYSSTPTPLSLPSTSMSTITAVDAPGTGTAGSTGTPCCDTGRPVATDPVTGHVICSCQYDSGRLPVNTCAPRLPAVSAASPLAYGASTGSPLAYGASTGSPLTYGAAAYPSTEHNPYPSIGVDSAAYFSQFAGNPYVLKDGMAADVAMYSTSGYRYPAYDPSLYGYGAPYDLAARRKNATREATGTLKAWLNEHKTNPYPTKGEKIMLAIITKMTLTQVSTWFANARRRLKKENKMTWEPKNKTESEEETDKCSDALENDVPVIDSDKDSSRKSRRYSDNYGALSDKPPLKSECLSPKLECKDESNQEYNEDLQECSDLGKPKIWSLAATAAAKSPSLSGAWPQDRLPAIHPKDEQTLSSSGANTFQLPPTVSSYDYFPPRQSFSQYPVAANASSSSPRNSSSTSCATFSKSGPPIHQDLHVNYQQQSIQGYAGNEIAHVAPVSISGSPANLISNNHTSVPHDLVQPPSVSTDITGLNDTAHTDSNTPVAGQSFHESSLNYRENQIATAGASGIATQSPMMHPSPALLASPSSFLHQTVYHPPNEVLPTSGYPAGVYSDSLANSAQTVSGNQLSTHGHHPSDHHHLQLPEQQQHSHVTSNRDQTGLMTYTQQQFNPIQSHLSSSN